MENVTKSYPNCNSICTPSSELTVGEKYQYYESFPSCIWDVELLEDNSDDKMINLKLKVLDNIHGIKVDEGYEFEVSIVNEPIGFVGMWKIYQKGEYRKCYFA